MKTLVIDTVDRLYPLCMDFVCEREGMSHPSDEGYGKGWQLVRKEWEKLAAKLNRQDCALLFVAHSCEKKIKYKRREVDRTQPDMSPQGLGILHDLSDFILYMGEGEDDKVKLFGLPREDLMVGCRGGVVIDGVEPAFAAIDAACKKAIRKGYDELRPTILLYGPPKIGKSTLAAQFPEPVVVDLENGYKFLEVPAKYIPGTWEEFLDSCRTIFNLAKTEGANK